MGDENMTLGMSFWTVLVQSFGLTCDRTCHSYTDTLLNVITIVFP